MKDWKTTLVGALLSAIIAIQPFVETGNWDLKAIGMAALVALVTYLAKDAGSKTPEVKQ